jgi:anti-anti-sigma factor
VIRLTRNQFNGKHTSIRVDGRLDGKTVNSLRAFVAELKAATPITLDLAGLASVDSDGLAALIALQAEGHELHGGSLYISRLLKEAQP